jgi:hypothetical protein
MLAMKGDDSGQILAAFLGERGGWLGPDHPAHPLWDCPDIRYTDSDGESVKSGATREKMEAEGPSDAHTTERTCRSGLCRMTGRSRLARKGVIECAVRASWL